jgi:hypothetical protein
MPRKYNYTPQEYAALCKYVSDYINFFYKPENLRLDKPMIWPYHCIEHSSGHKVAWELQEFLERWHERENTESTGRFWEGYSAVIWC